MKTPFDAPQAERLDLIRRVVEAVWAGARESAQIAASAQVAPRYALYALHAARLLGLVANEDPPSVTPVGQRLLATKRWSAGEKQVLREAFVASPQLSTLADLVLGASPPARTVIAERLLQGQSAALDTALRRASTLLAWRRFLMPEDDGPQLRFAALEWSEEPLPPLPATPTTVEQPPEVAAVPEAEAISSESGADEASAIRTAASEPLPDSIVPPPPEPVSTLASMIPDTSATDVRPAPVAVMNDNDLAYLRRQIANGAAILFTGAGFSVGAQDANDRPLPTGDAFARELWKLCYPSDEFDGSSLQDIFEHAQRRHSKALAEMLRVRFAVRGASLPAWYERWFSFPWFKVYTLNVDDAETAAERHFSLPRPVRPLSALRDDHATGTHGVDVIHLNGLAVHGPEGVTFSHDQFSQRLARQEPFYAQLAAEVLTRPFVFVGSPLDEPLFWQHVGMRGVRTSASENELRPKGFLVSPTLNRAREEKLRAHNIVWVRATAQEFSEQILSRLDADAGIGRVRLSSIGAVEVGDERNIVEVADAAIETGRRTEFLLGEEPSWADIRGGRAVEREEDAACLARVRADAFASRTASQPVPVLAVTATAGAGKTTLLMKIALQLQADGLRVAWIGTRSEVAPAALTRYYRAQGRPSVLVIDDAGRYGSQLVPMLLDLVKHDAIRVVVLGLRSYHEHQLSAPGGESLKLRKHQIGRLTDVDIDRLLEALEREKRLGELRGKSRDARRAAFRERADRQILVAMIEATSGVRFEDRIVAEWQAQEPVARYVYALCALATAQGYPLLQEEVLLACDGGTRELDAIKRLLGAKLLTEDADRRYRVRHRLIAEKLVEELAERGSQLEKLVVGLCRALAIQTSPEEPRSSRRRRVLKWVLNHNGLLRMLDDAQSARNVYGQLEKFLDSDYHFWLQRGCLELEDGDIRLAENFIHQAAAINADDALVETAMAHMQLRKAIGNPGGPDADKTAESAFEVLRRLIAARGSRDHYPVHVFGSQALGWCRRAGLTPRARRALLREAKEIVGRALGIQRNRNELQQLFEDLKREELRPQ